ncbi:MAG: response regulator [Pseudonocardiaceae bacterium]
MSRPTPGRLRGPLRVVVVDDHQMVLDGLRAMLAAYSGQVEIVGEATEPELAMKIITGQEPDITLLDVRLRGSSGLDLCAEIRKRQPACKVVFLTVYDDEQYLYQALRLGAAGFLLKRVRGAELVDHLQRIHQGEVLIDPSLATKVAMSVAHLRGGEFWPGARLGLTQRESEVLALMVAGLSNRAIAGRLTVSEETVKTHARGIYRKLGVPDRSGAVAAALREGVFQ